MSIFRLKRPTVLLVLGCLTAVTSAEEVTISAGRDNTIFEDQSATSNGQGALFVGTSGQGISRRTLMYFDVAGNIPDRATINSVSLSLTVGRASGDSDDQTQSIHRLNADWGEGVSRSGDGAGGGGGAGAEAAMNDATWTIGLFPDDTTAWMTPGGDFESVPSASASVPMAKGEVTWSSDEMVADVQAWLDDPVSNYGWILIGDEEGKGTSRRYASRESDSGSPMLTIDFDPAEVGNGFNFGGLCGLGMMIPLMLCVPGLCILRRTLRSAAFGR